MAASITTTAADLETQLFEVAGAIQELEVAQSATNRLTITPNVEAQTITVSFTCPATFSGTGGNISMSPSTYLA